MLKRLRALVLNDANIVDADLNAFATIKSLRILYLERTIVSRTAVEQLKTTLPTLRVFGP